MRHLQARLVNVWNAPYEVNVNNESSDNWNNRVDLVDVKCVVLQKRLLMMDIQY